MPASVKILADSINLDGSRLTTFEVSTHLFIWAEWMTHRQFSRNAQSNRAIPVKKVIESVRNDPAMPFHWGKNKAGMQAEEELSPEQIEVVKAKWLDMAYQACDNAEYLSSIGGHKQFVNRSLAPYMWIKAVISSTSWDNFFNLRDHAAAQPEIAIPARWMREALEKSIPEKLKWGQWHLPFTTAEQREQLPIDVLRKISTARAARVSYATHLGEHSIEKDLELHDILLTDGHMSPFEHCAQASNNMGIDVRQVPVSNFDPSWFQYRKVVELQLYLK
jgi:thymidylate synthase ThyX